MGADGSQAGPERPWRVATTQLFVGDITSPSLDDSDARHLSRVLRLRDGELVCAADGRGAWRLCRYVAGTLEPEADTVQETRLEPLLTVGFAPVKGDRPEWAVQKLTEVGVDRVVILFTQRSVVRWDGHRAEKHLSKLRRTALEAAQQCRRLWLPEVLSVGAGVSPGGPAGDGCLADAGGRPLRGTDHTVLVGPEGGWTAGEREGRDTVALAEDILRGETAAVVAGAAMASLRIGLSKPGLA